MRQSGKSRESAVDGRTRRTIPSHLIANSGHRADVSPASAQIATIARLCPAQPELVLENPE